jgi:limonene-1,2-epoxide hydrolase
MSPIKMEKVERARRLILKFAEAINLQQLEAIGQLIDEECIWETHTSPPDGASLVGRRKIVGYWRGKFTQALRYSIKIEELLGFGIHCVLFEQIEEEQTKGGTVVRREVEIFTIIGEKITKIRSYGKYS